jgi:hypothetical protein
MSKKSSYVAESGLQKSYVYVTGSITSGAQRVNNLQEHDGALNFAIDAWTSPNHKAYVAVTVHYQKDGVLIAMLLDLVEVAESHSGAHLAAVFVKILEDFAITDKVSAQPF